MTATKLNGWPEALVVTSLLIGNCFYSVAKKSISAATPLLESKLGATRLDIGDFSTSFSLSYGASKFIGGALSDVVSPFQLFIIGLYLAAALNIGISFAGNISTIKLLWIVNGLSQGAAGPALSKLVVQMFPPHLRSDVWSNLTLVSVSAACSCSDTMLTITRMLLPPLSTGVQYGVHVRPRAAAALRRHRLAGTVLTYSARSAAHPLNKNINELLFFSAGRIPGFGPGLSAGSGGHACGVCAPAGQSGPTAVPVSEHAGSPSATAAEDAATPAVHCSCSTWYGNHGGQGFKRSAVCW
jgi:MFS family permease